MNETILIVDDEESQRSTLLRPLQSAGFTVDAAEGGVEALELLQENSYDVVLLDIRMPEMDGIEVLQKIMKGYPETDVIMITGFADFMNAIESMKSGAKDYLVKPIHPTELITRLKALFREREMKNTLQELQHNFSSVALYSLLNPIYSITSILDHIIKGRSGQLTKEQTHLMTYARNLGEKTINMMRHISGLSTPETKRPVGSELRLTDIGALAESVFIRYEILGRPRELRLKKTISRPLPQIMCDPDSVVQALNNILDYSIDQSITEGSISLQVTLQADTTGDQSKARVAIIIRDSSIGVPGEALAKLLDEQGNLDGKEKLPPEIKLTEMGLVIAKHLIEDNGGTFDVKFDAGSGNTFTITFPAAG